MQRRTFTRRLGALAPLGAAMAAAGCSQLGLGGGTPLEVDTIDSSSTASGDVEVSATISNPTESSQSATMVSQVDIRDGDTYTKRQDITVPPDDENSYTVTHELDFSSSLSADRYEYSVSLE